eukprot:Lithocolla_globosa_v1_NODE_475_length_3955_cov_7.586410.p1 type:complete len:766 gc:universal NODE_475_length_3955_cov_7.586410:2511-214(-)
MEIILSKANPVCIYRIAIMTPLMCIVLPVDGQGHKSFSSSLINGWKKKLGKIYGGKVEERIMTGHLIEINEAVLPTDSHSISVGQLMSVPLTLVYSVFYDQVDPLNTLVGSQAIAYTWYGRGLTFTEEESTMMAFTLQTIVQNGGFSTVSAGDLIEIRSILSQSIHRAWGEDEILGFQPGVLIERSESDPGLVPKAVVSHPYDTPTYINHATATVVEESLGKHRDMRDNLPHMSPLLVDTSDEAPLAQYPANGKPLIFQAEKGSSFTVDGYGVIWDVGVKWKFQIGFLDQAGLTIFNIRFVLPPSVEFPQGQEVPYLFKITIPEFGTTYSNTNTGSLYSAAFLESHFQDHAGLVPGVNCRGGSSLTLPVFRSKNLSFLDDTLAHTLLYYSTYGLGVNDPVAQALLGVDLPYNSWPTSSIPNNGNLIPHSICLEEIDLGQNLWHIYSVQRLRSLSIFSATISNAYNVVNKFEFFSNGRMKISEVLHGKPAIMGSGIPKSGGAYASSGRGGFAANHVHWHVVHLEPYLQKNDVIENDDDNVIINKIRVHDLAQENDENNWFGSGFNMISREINSTNQEKDMIYSYEKQRFWSIHAETKSKNKDFGGLKIFSSSFAPPPFKDFDSDHLRFNETEIKPEETLLNHWWLQRNVWVGEKNGIDSHLLLSPSKTPDCRVAYTTHRCVVENGQISDDPVMWVVMAKYHGVTTEETPVQNGFLGVDVEIWPYNLFDFNPNILVRYIPEYSEVFQNSPFLEVPVYQPPYESEWDN